MLNNKLPMLITGLPGVHGYNCFHYFRKRLGDRVIGIKPAHTEELKYPGVYGISAEHTEALKHLFSTYKFKTVIDASGCCALNSCEYNPQLAALINCEFGTSISVQACKYNAQLIRFSTDMVFDGAGAGHYKEEDRICPITVYGKTMAGRGGHFERIRPHGHLQDTFAYGAFAKRACRCGGLDRA